MGAPGLDSETWVEERKWVPQVSILRPGKEATRSLPATHPSCPLPRILLNPIPPGGTMPRNPGRVAGLWYLVLVLLGPLRLIYIPTKLFVHDNSTATVHNIAAHETLFRLGIAADLLGALALVFTTLAFYRLFAAVSRNLAAMVVIFGGIMPAVLYFVGMVGD